MVSGRFPPRKIAPRLGLGFGLGLGLELGLGAIFLEGNCPRTEENLCTYINLIVKFPQLQSKSLKFQEQ